MDVWDAGVADFASPERMKGLCTGAVGAAGSSMGRRGGGGRDALHSRWDFLQPIP